MQACTVLASRISPWAWRSLLVCRPYMDMCHHVPARLTASPVPVQLLRKKGLASADKKAGRIASEGLLKSYIHAGARWASALDACIILKHCAAA